MINEIVSVEKGEPPGISGVKAGKRRPRHGGCIKPFSRIQPVGNPVDVLPVSGNNQQNFRRKFYPCVPDEKWNDWQWQLKNRISSKTMLKKVLRLSTDESAALEMPGARLPVGITPYYASLLDLDNPAQPLRKCVVPVVQEFDRSFCEMPDPLSEDKTSPVPGLVHRYPDRVLFLVTNFCSVNCRYCTRSRIIENRRRNCGSVRQWKKGIEYIRNNPAVRDVLISGGDPFTLPDEKIEWLLKKIRAIPHVEIIRIGTKTPAVLPQRITPELTGILKRYHPLWLSLHFTHPDEITPECGEACKALADAGIPLGSQTVLLAGINDDVDTLKKLFHRLMQIRVRPYYLYQCDPISGSRHLRTPVEKGIELIAGLRGHTTGYAVPQFVIDAPGGGGKIPVMPEYVIGREDGYILLRNYQGRILRYPDIAACKDRPTEVLSC